MWSVHYLTLMVMPVEYAKSLFKALIQIVTAYVRYHTDDKKISNHN